eukprot:892265-Pelagomonas_calceolata.AAC.2
MEARQRHAAMMGRRQSPPSAPLPNAAAAAVAVSEHKASLQGLAAQGGDGGLSAAVSAGLQVRDGACEVAVPSATVYL